LAGFILRRHTRFGAQLRDGWNGCSAAIFSSIHGGAEHHHMFVSRQSSDTRIDVNFHSSANIFG